MIPSLSDGEFGEGKSPMDVENAKYDDSVSAVIVGRSGLFVGETSVVNLGQRVVVGRSRMCDLSVARTSECLRLGKEALEQHRSYRKISRKHLSICLLDHDRLEVEDLSTNGTAVNGYRVDKIVVSGLSRMRPVVVEFGDGEKLEVTLTDGGETDLAHRNVRPEYGAEVLDEMPSSYDKTPIP